MRSRQLTDRKRPRPPEPPAALLPALATGGRGLEVSQDRKEDLDFLPGPPFLLDLEH